MGPRSPALWCDEINSLKETGNHFSDRDRIPQNSQVVWVLRPEPQSRDRILCLRYVVGTGYDKLCRMEVTGYLGAGAVLIMFVFSNSQVLHIRFCILLPFPRVESGTQNLPRSTEWWSHDQVAVKAELFPKPRAVLLEPWPCGEALLLLQTEVTVSVCTWEVARAATLHGMWFMNSKVLCAQTCPAPSWSHQHSGGPGEGRRPTE